MPDNTHTPIFLHSLWRSGSTYLFNKFRTSATPYYAFQESIHEIAIFAQKNRNILVEVGALDPLLNHPTLDQGYFHELYEMYDFWKGNIEKSVIYDQYFDKIGSPELKSYLHSIINNAPQRPVFQECRTCGRIGAMKSLFGGFHVFVFRNPHDQWWSIIKDHYFTDVIMMALTAEDAPLCVKQLRDEIGLKRYRSTNIEDEIDHYDKIQYPDHVQYELFITLWILAFIEGRVNADILLSIDRASDDAEYRRDLSTQFESIAQITNIDLSDCHAPRRSFRDDERDFFRRIENKALARIAADERMVPHIEAARDAIASYEVGPPPSPEAYELRRTSRHIMNMASMRVGHIQNTLNSRIVEIAQQLNQKNVEIDAIAAQLDELTAERLALETKLLDHEAMLATANNRVASLRAQLAIIRASRRSERNAARAQMANTLATHNGAMSHLETSHANHIATLVTLHSEELRRLNALWQDQLTWVRDDLQQQLVSEIGQSKERLNEISAELADARKSLDHHTNALSGLEQSRFVKLGRRLGLLAGNAIDEDRRDW